MVLESWCSEKSDKIVDKLHVVGNNLSNNKSIENQNIIKKLSQMDIGFFKNQYETYLDDKLVW